MAWLVARHATTFQTHDKNTWPSDTWIVSKQVRSTCHSHSNCAPHHDLSQTWVESKRHGVAVALNYSSKILYVISIHKVALVIAVLAKKQCMTEKRVSHADFGVCYSRSLFYIKLESSSQSRVWSLGQWFSGMFFWLSCDSRSWLPVSGPSQHQATRVTGHGDWSALNCSEE